MKIMMQSAFTGKFHTRELDITAQQYADWLSGKGLIQNIFPQLSSEEREFLMTGTTPEEWDELNQED